MTTITPEEVTSVIDKYSTQTGRLRLQGGYGPLSMTTEDAICILGALHHDTRVEQLRLYDFHLSGLASEILELIKRNKTISHLDLGFTHTHDIAPIAETMTFNNTITYLDLSNNKITDIESFSEVLECNKKLSHLILARNQIREIEKFARSLVNNSTLEHLDLSSNKLSRDDLWEMCRSLKQNCGLKFVHLGDNASYVHVDTVCDVIDANRTLSTFRIHYRGRDAKERFSSSLLSNHVLVSINGLIVTQTLGDHLRENRKNHERKTTSLFKLMYEECTRKKMI